MWASRFSNALHIDYLLNPSTSGSLMTKHSSLMERLSTRSARAHRSLRARRLVRWFGGRGLATLALGAALSAGGVAEFLDHAHFVVRKDSLGARVVEDDKGGRKVMATLGRGLTASSVFRLTRALPVKLVSQQNDVFGQAHTPGSIGVVQQRVTHDVFHEEMSRINGTIRQDFFENAVPFGDLIHKKALKYDVDPALVAAVVETESSFRTGARSQVGARGLMQLMPRTGRWMGARNLDDPEQNLEAGTKYLKYLQKRFDGNLDKAIAAYNGGEGNVKRYNGVPPFPETQSYVTKVLSKYELRNQELKAYELNQHPRIGELAAIR
jgi:soluble lytic murein transglycosylase-like protein